MADETLLGKDDILNADDIKFEIVDVPEWKGKVRVRGAMSFEMDDYESSLVSVEVQDDGKTQIVNNPHNTKARLVVKCVVDAKGNQVFSDADADELGRKSPGAVSRLFQKIQTLSGKTKAARDALEKNSAGPASSSTSSSPGT